VAINSRRKGKVGELEAAALLRSLFGWAARRRQQFSGKAGDDDLMVDQTPGLFWEVKREERLNLHQAVKRAAEDAGRRCPVVLHRKSRSEWLLTIRVQDLPRLCHAYDSAQNDTVAAAALPYQDACHSEGC